MIVATFNGATGWAGTTIDYDNAVFTLDGHGAVAAADVLRYDGQGHLDWAYAGLQEWVQQVAGVTAAAAPRTQPNEPAATAPSTEERDDPAIALIDALGHGEKASERGDAAKALGMAGDPRAVELLLESARRTWNPEPDVDADALRRVRDPSVVG